MMSLRIIPAILLVLVLTSLPNLASQPQGLAAKLITNPAIPSSESTCYITPFDWGVALGGNFALDPADTVRLEIAIIPFRSGTTFIGLETPQRMQVRDFFGLEFVNGLVNGIPYRRSGWNDVSVLLRPATQDYLLTVNGRQAGPFPYDPFCQQEGGCFELSGFALVAAGNADEATGWIDSIDLSRESATGQEPLLQLDFDSCAVPRVNSGGLLIDSPQH